MIVGIFDPYLDTLSGGEVYTLSVASCLSEEHQVSVFWDDLDILNKAESKFKIDLKKVKIVENIFTPNIRLIKKLEETKKYDLIFFLSDGSIPVSLSKKTILHFQFPVEWVKPNLIMRLKLKKISAIVCNSYFTKNYIDKTFSFNSKVVYPPVSLLNSVSFDRKENIILSVGRFNNLGVHDDFKKIHFMTSVFKKISEKNINDWKFVIVTSYQGDRHSSLTDLKKEIEGYNIEIQENIPKEALDNLYKKAKIYWHAAGFNENEKTHPERLEHFGISTVEAMSAGCIPVVINAGGQKEIIEHEVNGYLWNTEEELIHYTLSIIYGKSINIQINNQLIEKKFGFNRFCKEINELLL